MSNLNPDALYEYRNFVKTHSSSTYTEDDSKVLLNIFTKILTPTTTFNLDIAFNSSLGGFSLKSKAVNQPNIAAPTALPDLFDKIVWEANLRIAAPMFNKIVEIAVMKMQADAVNQARISNAAGQSQTSTQVIKPVIQQNPAEKAQQMIDTWVQQGYFTKEGNDYLTIITTTGGVLKMNGKVLDQKTSSLLGVPSTTTPATKLQ
jgi:hypothetical protein